MFQFIKKGKQEIVPAISKLFRIGFLVLFPGDLPRVTVAIPGAKRISQLAQNVKAALLTKLTAEEMQLIDEVTPPGGGRKIWPA
jgi:aryl-alcohol dehydrogenase-like predicted oxidoreductase